ITFTVTTFTTNAIATNALQLFLNGSDVTSQLELTEVTSVPLTSPKTNFFVRYTGTLANNSIYRGKIIALDTNGKGTTNNWLFDTFAYFDPNDTNNPTRFLLVEAEDYNYNGGDFQTYPPVSGTDDTTTSQRGLFPRTAGIEALGPQVNGFPAGYYGAAGIEDIDYKAHTGDNPDPIARNQYRGTDRTGSMQGTKGGGFDTPR